MPNVCEVCGIDEKTADTNLMQNHLHICPNCMKDRQLLEFWGKPDEEIQ